MYFRILCSLWLVGIASIQATDAPEPVWQFTAAIPGSKSTAYLWIPPTCKQVRGIILAQQTILETNVVTDPIIRQAASDENLAIVQICPDCLGHYDYKTNPVEVKYLQDALDALAQESGYDELSQAPLLSVGHSGNGIFAWMIAYSNPSRMIGVVGLHCMSINPPREDSKATIQGVPVLDISGQYESWGQPDMALDDHWRWLRGGLLEMRGHYNRALLSELVDPGGCHFSFNEPMAKYVALFIRKAAQNRLPPLSPDGSTSETALRDIPYDSGWLTDIQMLTPSEHPPAPYLKYSGDPSLAFWHFDQEMAEATETYRAEAQGKTDQRITFVQDGKPLPAEWLETLKFNPISDGMTMKVSGTFLSETPAGVSGSGKPLGHSSGPIHFKLIGGWRGGGEPVGPDTFRIHPGYLGMTNNLMVLAYQEGDKEYAWAEQPAQIIYPSKNTQGKPQTITFPTIADQVASSAPMPLKATSDSGLPVEYYVTGGPALVAGTSLKFTPLPPRSHYPVKVTVVAYQWGRTLDPPVQSAASVEQTFNLDAPAK